MPKIKNTKQPKTAREIYEDVKDMIFQEKVELYLSIKQDLSDEATFRKTSGEEAQQVLNLLNGGDKK